MAVAGRDGHFYTARISFSENQSSKSTVLYAKKLFQTKVAWNILSIRWVSSNRLLLLCLNHAIAIIFQEDKNGELTEAQLIQTFNLSLQRRVPAAVEINGKYIVFGDELGCLHLFRYHKNNEVIKLYENCHKEGVTSLIYHENKLYSGGRDGKVKEYRLQIDPQDDMKIELILCASYLMPFVWISGLYVNMGQILVCGFEKEDFIVLSLNEKRTIAKIPCGNGGGSRKWDFKYGHGLNGSPNASFAFIKEREIFYTFLPMAGYLNVNLKEGLHSRAINCALQLESQSKENSEDGNYIPYITGSEDGTLKLFQWDRINSRILSTQNMDNHVSSVRSAWKITLNVGLSKKTFIFTGGGKSQLCIYELDAVTQRIDLLKEIVLVKTRCKQTEGDVRIMDISGINLEQDEIWCFGACSDGFVRVLYFNGTNYKFKIVGRLKGNDHAVTRVKLLQTEKNTVSVCGVTSNGYFIIWTWGKVDGIHSSSTGKIIPLEKPPIFKKMLRRTALMSISIVGNDNDNEQYSMVCGGDDCSVSFWSLKISITKENNLICEISECWTRDQIQRGAVVGVHIDPRLGTVCSISNDQIVGFWDMNGELKRKVYAGVSDCQGFLVDGENKCVLCYGKGVSWVPIV